MAIVKSEYNVLNPTSGEYDTHYLKTNIEQVEGLQSKIDEFEGKVEEAETAINQLSDEKVDNSTFNELSGTVASLAGTSEVVASGSNYVRWANGLQICWGSVSSDVTANGTIGKTVNFAQSFSSLPSVFVTAGSTADNSGWIYNTASAHQVARNTFELRVKNEENKPWTGLRVYWFAIGKWK